MAFTNEERKEICAKILYLGAKGSGKTSNLRSLFSLTSQEVKSGMSNFSKGEDHSAFFEFLPFSVGKVLDYEIKLHLFAFDLESPLESLKKLIFSGVDGFVFVVDSRMERLLANRETLKLARFTLREEGYALSELPHVLQFNKRDERMLLPCEVLSKVLNPYEAPEQESVATKSQGTLETLNLMTRQIIDRVVPGYSVMMGSHAQEKIRPPEAQT